MERYVLDKYTDRLHSLPKHTLISRETNAKFII